jgi:hypothetical protein
MPRPLLFALVCATLTAPFSASSASADPARLMPRRPIWVEREGVVVHQRYAGAINGRVVSIDYGTGLLTVDTPRRGRMLVTILPSTSIQGQRGAFHTIADIARGERVHVVMSRRGDAFIAQIITIR